MFLYGFARSERQNIDPDELLTLREIGAAWLAADSRQIARALEQDALQERWPMTKQTRPRRLTRALLETADDTRRSGVMGAAAHDKITLRHLGDKAPAAPEPITGNEIRSLREQARLGQAVFARYLNLTVGCVSQLERGTKHPTGPALVLLDIIRRKGIEAIPWQCACGTTDG